MLIDTHCHLDFPQLTSDLENILSRAKEQNVEKMISICCQVRKISPILDIVNKYPQVYCSVGTHPCSAHEELDVTEDEIREIAKHPKVVAIGEVGLDYYHDVSKIKEQKEVFSKYIRLSRELDLPLIIHSRSCDDDMIEMLQNAHKEGKFDLILHSFSSGAKLAEVCLSLGGYISLSGMVTFKNAQQIRDIAINIPHDRLLVETDAPYLAPVPHRGKCNEPAFVADTARYLAEMLDISYSDLLKLTGDNAHRVFKKLSYN